MKRLFLLLLIPICQVLDANAAPNKVTDTVKKAADTSINRPAPSFKLKDFNGKTVSLADYKGKILVIDFWATWCVPCRYSFPAVKMAVEKYKNDSDVKFLFIDTREKQPNYRDLAKKFMADNHYPFYYVFDEKSDDGKLNATYKSYVMPGIPTKYFIDGNGIIRYKIVGYDPGKTNNQSAADIEAEIEKLKNGK